MSSQALAQFSSYEHLYVQEREKTIAEFLTTNSHLSDVELEMERYEHFEAEIAELPGQLKIGNTILLSTGDYLPHVDCYQCKVYTILHTEPLKIALVVEARAWKTSYGRNLNSRYRSSMDRIVQFVADYDKKLSRPVLVRNVMIEVRAFHYSCYCRIWKMFAA